MTIKMKFVITIFIMAIVCVSGAGSVLAQSREYKEYTVTKGDTMWSIAQKEIADPFMWPKIWKENDEIKNPDLLYPGQKIRIPLELLQKEAEPLQQPKPVLPEEIRPVAHEIKMLKPETQITPVKKEPIVDMATLIASGYISETIQSSGEITGTSSDRTVLGRGDYAYIDTRDNPATGKQFYIIRPSGKIRHPKTGTMLGHLIDVVGIAEVIGREGGHVKAKITASYSEVFVGDLLDNYYEMDLPFLVDKPRTPDINGFIVAARHRRILNGQHDIVYIDKGVKDGIEPGDLIQSLSKNVPNGLLQVISTREATAAAIIRKSEKEVSEGDLIGSAVVSE